MNSVTSVLKRVGKQEHSGIDGLARQVVKVCHETGINKTKTGNDVNEETVTKIVRGVISRIRTGRGSWREWTIEQGHNSLRLSDNRKLNAFELQTANVFDDEDVPQIKVRVDPMLEGVDTNDFYKEFFSLEEATRFYENEKYATEIYLVCGKLTIPLFGKNKTFIY